MYFTIIGRLTDVRTFAIGKGIRQVDRLRRQYGRGNWRKRKGIALIEILTGEVRRAEVHWYEATGIGRREFKIKHFLD